MNIPEEAVEAAAEAMYLHDWAEDSSVDDAEALWATETRRARNTYTQLARAALEAAYPAIRYMAAREALDGLIAKHDQSTSRHPDGSAARFDEQRAAFRIMAYRDAEYPEAD